MAGEYIRGDRGADSMPISDSLRKRRYGADVKKRPAPNQGLVKWLSSCPEKDYFVPISSELAPATHPLDRVYGILDIGQSVDDAIVAMRGPLPERGRRKRRSS